MTDSSRALPNEVLILRAAVAEEIRDSLSFEMALRFYAEGGNDGGELARQAIESRPSDVHISELLEKEPA